jgi:hypothetical protein
VELHVTLRSHCGTSRTSGLTVELHVPPVSLWNFKYPFRLKCYIELCFRLRYNPNKIKYTYFFNLKRTLFIPCLEKVKKRKLSYVRPFRVHVAMYEFYPILFGPAARSTNLHTNKLQTPSQMPETASVILCAFPEHNHIHALTFLFRQSNRGTETAVSCGAAKVLSSGMFKLSSHPSNFS